MGGAPVARSILAGSSPSVISLRSPTVIEQLAAIDRTRVQQALRTALHVEEDEKKLRVILELIGHVGDESDIAELERKIGAESEIVANAAYEAKLRLTDPLRLAEHW